MAATYDDFRRVLQKHGLSEGNFSAADLALAQKSPDFGVTLANYKNDWKNAKTAEQKALINEQANALRQNYGGYTGGRDGSGYYAVDPLDTYGKTAMANLQGYDAFSFDASDPLYRQYLDNYLRNGQRAMRDTLGKTAAMTGGTPSSYAVSAAAQAYNDYAANAAEMIPTLRKQAYDEYLGGFGLERQKLADVQGQQQRSRDEEQRKTENARYDDALAYDRAWNEDARAYDRGEQARKNRLETEKLAYDRAAAEEQTAYQRALALRNLENAERSAALENARKVCAEAGVYTKEYAALIGHPEFAGLSYPQTTDPSVF